LNFVSDNLLIEFTDSFSFFNFGDTSPDVDKRDRPWLKTSNGVPVGWFVFFNNQWRRMVTSPIGTLVDYSGPWDGVFDTSGRGIVGGEWDGWAICNGQNGTPNLTDKFIVPSTTWSSVDGWTSTVGGVASHEGGSATRTLTIQNVPAHYHVLSGFAKTDEGGAGKGGGDWETSGGTKRTETAGGQDDGTTKPFYIIPPFIALGKVKCIGY
jgi:hypothetical protein